jgi:hypothetical protein
MPEHLAEAMMKSIPPTGWGDIATRTDLTSHATLLRGEMAGLRGEMHLAISQVNRTVVLTGAATALSSWGGARRGGALLTKNSAGAGPEPASWVFYRSDNDQEEHPHGRDHPRRRRAA